MFVFQHLTFTRFLKVQNFKVAHSKKQVLFLLKSHSLALHSGGLLGRCRFGYLENWVAWVFIFPQERMALGYAHVHVWIRLIRVTCCAGVTSS